MDFKFEFPKCSEYILKRKCNIYLRIANFGQTTMTDERYTIKDLKVANVLR